MFEGFEFARQLFMFALGDGVAAEEIDGPAFGGCSEPCGGIIWDARLRPLPECGDESLLREVFGEADVTGEAREAGDDARGLDAPDGFDGAMQGLMWIGSGHCYRSHQLSILRCKSQDASPLIVGSLIWQFSSALHFVLDLLFGQDGCEFFHLKDLADFDFGVAAVGVGATLDPLDGLFEGLDLPEPEAGDELLGLGERAVDDGARLAGEFDACAFGAGVEAIHGEHDAGLDELFVVLAHLGHELWIGEGAFFFCLWGCFDDDHESHCEISFEWVACS